MFLNNKYTKWYNNLIKSRKIRIPDKLDYYEIHHIIPKCMGGSDSQENLVKLTAKEHYIAHLLLTEMCIDKEYQRKMKFSLQKMMGNSSTWSSAQYEIARKKNHEALVGRTFSEEHKRKLSISNTGLKRNEKTKSNISKYAKSRTKDKNSFYGKKHSEETKLKLSEKAKKRIWITNEKESKVIYSSTPIPEGWRRGRIKPY